MSPSTFPDTAKELNLAFIHRSVTPSDATMHSLDLINQRNPSLNCFITRLDESARAAAQEADRRFASGTPRGPLDGIPMAAKDVIYISGVKCTAGSRILAQNIAPYDSPVIKRIKEAGAVLVGTTNLHEFTAGVTSNNPHYGPVRNPWNHRRVAGGSSGGSAASVASGMVPVALGTDTAGSVRIPAGLCGVLGFKPTYGRVSRLGVIPLAASLDTVGVISRSSWDAAAVLQTISGHDEGDSTTVDTPVPDYLRELERPLGRTRVGIVKKAFDGLVDAGVGESFDLFVGRLNEIGCRVETLELEGWREAASDFVPIRRAEATAFHLRWLESTPELYGDDVRRLMEKGRDIKAVEYINAVNSRPSLMQKFAASMVGFDFVALPTTEVPAPPVGESRVRIGENEVEVYHALNSLTLPFNVVGFPVVSIPMGLVGGLPVGAQLAAKPFEEAALLRLVQAYETKFGLFPAPPDVPGEMR